MLPPRALAAGGVVGPLLFVGTWSLLGAGTDGYDPTRDAISRLAALGTTTRPAMTAGLVGLAGGMVLYGLALRPGAEGASEDGRGRAWLLPVANGLSTLAVAALPLGGGYDTAHGVAAGLGYVTLAAIPIAVGSGAPRSSRHFRLSVATGALSGACLLASVLLSRDGLYQRLGLTAAQLWVVLSALGLLRSPRSSSTTRPVPGPAGPRR